MLILVTYAARWKDGIPRVEQCVCEQKDEQKARDRIEALDNFICFSEDFRGTPLTGLILPTRVRSRSTELLVRET
jgi:hypothetical protein